MRKYIEFYKCFTDTTRVRILHLLMKANSELCCCELTDSLEEPLYNISKHLKILKNAGLVEEREEGRWVYFCITKNSDQFKESLLKTISYISDTQKFKKDLENFNRRLSMREGGKCVIGVQKSYLLEGKKEGNK